MFFEAVSGNSFSYAFKKGGRETSLSLFLISFSFPIPGEIIGIVSSMGPLQAKESGCQVGILATCRDVKSLVKKKATVYNLCFSFTLKLGSQLLKNVFL